MIKSGGIMKKRLVLCVLISCLLCGCGEQTPDMDTLVYSRFGDESIESIKVVSNMSMESTVDGSQMLGDGQVVNMTMSLSSSTVYNKDIQYADGTIEMSVLGQDFSQSFETYLTKEYDSLVSYTRESGGEWYKSESDTLEFEDISKVGYINYDLFSEYMLQSPDYNDSEFVITGEVPFLCIGDIFGETTDGILDTLGIDFEDDIYSDMYFDVSVMYGKETLELDRVEVSLSSPFEYAGSSISVLNMSLDFVDINSSVIELPDELKSVEVSEPAVEEEPYVWGDTERAGYTKLCDDLFSSDFVMLDDILNKYGDIDGEEAQNALQTYINSYSKEDVERLCKVWEYLQEDEKKAIAYLVSNSIIDKDNCIKFGAVEEELNSLLN